MDKSKKETLLGKVREFFTAHNISAEVVEKFEEVVLADGVTKAQIEPAIEAGAAMVLIAEDGTALPAKPGQYQLEDGRVCVVVDEGVVSEVKEKAADKMPDEEMKDENKASEAVSRIIERIETEKIFTRLQALEAEVTDLKKVNKFLKEENEHLKKDLVDTKQFTKETFETLLGEPSKDPIVKPAQFAGLPTGETALEIWMAKHAKKEN